eukprot:gnl/TRDRNA2_/TRDRNA2_145264_c0_seq1.p1 gnl/TRDRNA2_/TRDRNA2_145264_c0~~gnl/TRDRNA2_/TRDRNA2_145264_c0_seq1.p1  ORF type:complete len:300 (-),score=27.17 gnl/TRDRNA2_/TRDRNA2_145264_c0_seq1:111-1010(-)
MLKLQSLRRVNELLSRECIIFTGGSGPGPLAGGLCTYINLDRRPDRRRKMEALVKPHKWLSRALKRLSAVDGQTLSWEKLVSDRKITPDAELQATRCEELKRPTIGKSGSTPLTHLTLGACGCALSHLQAWQALASSEAKWSLIFEDDLCTISDNFDEEFSKVLRALPHGWNICYLGFANGARDAQDVMLPKGSTSSGTLTTLPRQRPHNGWLPGLWAYVISRSFARKIVSDASVCPFSAQADQVLSVYAQSVGGGYALEEGEFLAFSLPSEGVRRALPGARGIAMCKRSLQKKMGFFG